MNSTVATILVAVLSALFGAGGGGMIVVKWRELRDRREESEIGRLRADIAEAKAGHSSCEREVKKLQTRLTAVEHHHTSYLARWIKDGTKRVVWLNDKALLTIFAPLGLSREGVIGKLFSELLDPAAAHEIDRLDAQALAHPEVAASNVIQLHPLLPVMVIVKMAAVGRAGELVFEGYAYRTNDRMLADAMGADRQREQLFASGDHLLPQP